MKHMFNLDDYRSNPFREYGCNEFIGRGGIGYHPYNERAMRGGVITETEEASRIRHQRLEGTDEDKSKVLRQYIRTRDRLEEEDYDEEERQQDLNKINTKIRHLEQEIQQPVEEIEEEQEEEQEEENYDELLENPKSIFSFFNKHFSPEDFDDEEMYNEFKNTIGYSELNYDDLDEDEKQRYMEALAYIHELKPELQAKKKDKLLDEIEVINEDIGMYDFDQDEEEEIEIEPYDNYIFNEVKEKLIEEVDTIIKQLPHLAKDRTKMIDTDIGNRCEDRLSNNTNLFSEINKNNKGQIYNTSNDKCKYYTSDLLKYNEVTKDYMKKSYDKTKLDFIVVDFISENSVYELKSLSKSYDDYKKTGFINLVSNKITGESGEFKPIFKNESGKFVLDNIKTETKYKTFNCINDNKSRDYIVVFFLSDGCYSYEPLKDKNFSIDKNGRGKLNYTQKFKDYNIPISKLKILPENIFKKIF